MSYQQIKIIRSHSGLARFLAECGAEPCGNIPRFQEIPSPYAYSPDHQLWIWENKKIFIVEIRHRTFAIFEYRE